jgi:GntR family transcriptional repressor for pyruvate dehydrogenase complex
MTVVESVRDQLVALLEERAFRPGDPLPSERELMSILCVGRSSLREALSGLVAMNVLGADAGKSYRVRSLDPPPPALPKGLRTAQIAELFEARRVLEVGISELACERATEADFTAMADCLESIKRAYQARRPTAEVAARFHSLLARAAHNGLLESQLQGIRELMVRVGIKMERGYGSHFAEEQYESHRVLLDTLRQRNPATMREAMLHHLAHFADEAGVPHPEAGE